MKAIQISRFGGPEVLVLADVAKPEPGPGQVLIRVAAAGVNFAETLMREDNYVASYALPAIPGSEVAGTIEAVGPGVEGFAVGQRVGAVLPAAKTLTGGYAEYCVADAAITVPLPDALDFDQACALLVQGLTALYLTREASPAGRDVLITAAGGGVGSLLIQLARLRGAASVTAAASNPVKQAMARSLGAGRAVGYDALDGLAPTLIYESVGGEVFSRCFDVLAPKGVLVAYGSLNLQSFSLGIPELKRMVFGNQTFRGFAFGALLQPDSMRADLAQLFDTAAKGLLRTPIGARYPLADAAEAHRALAARDTVGKLVLVP
ncbi:MAG: zinc-binding alcohol dehydrogenase family protein [Sphingomonadales bacterium]|nr:MAG: zinc-binding alcohol dehydrogenase family protein [Sphingomonadales bacterium]